ncbi:MAG: hypothetical protein R2788_20630 [Saprospiraceae bacterium]
MSNTLAANERIVWELVSAPANSDLTPGSQRRLHGPAPTWYLMVRSVLPTVAKWSVDDASVMNNMGDPIVGDYVFRAYLKDCSLDCISAAAGPFTITVKEPFPVIACLPT